MSELTPEDKERLYDLGHYVIPVPPVTTGGWDRAAWIRFIDMCGQWRPKKENAS